MNDDKLEWIFASSDNQQLADRYDRWATQYDADHDGWEWIGPAKAAEQLRDLGAISTVLDAGCGTGRVGVELAATGWDGTLVGIDLSAGMLAVDGRCKTFDAGADGYGRGEACGVFLLRHSGPGGESDSDQKVPIGVLGVRVDASAANQDGRSGSLTAPNGLAQRAAIAEAWRESAPASFPRAVSTHGTGTALGDPIEVCTCHLFSFKTFIVLRSALRRGHCASRLIMETQQSNARP